jgi:uncharacterized membrane protein YfcA
MPFDLLRVGFISLDLWKAMQVVLLGFIGGVLSGFIGSGGAFFMTPGMMNLGVAGPIAVGTNITHKFGKAIVGSRKHGELGHVDRKLAVFMLITAAIGIRLAVWVMKLMFKGGKEHAGPAADLYISVVFVAILSVVSYTLLRDVLHAKTGGESAPSRRLVELLSRLRLRPLVYFPVADVRASLWVVLVCGLMTGYLAGTIGVGGFVGVPAMIYVLGVPAQVAAGSELFLAIFMGAFGALNYGFEGMVDLRLVLLLYTGSLLGIHIGAYGTKVVKELIIRFATGAIIALCVVSRAAAMAVYLRQLDLVGFDPAWDGYLNDASKAILYLSGVGTTGVILTFVFRAYLQRRRVTASIVSSTPRARQAPRMVGREA